MRMAEFGAIAATTEAIVRLLRASYRPADFNNGDLEFQVFTGEDFANRTITTGVSVFLYRVYRNNFYGAEPVRRLPDGTVRRSALPLDLHFLLTAWAPRASLQHEIAGWMMRVMEDNSV